MPSMICGCLPPLEGGGERRLTGRTYISDEKNRCMQVWHRYGRRPIQLLSFSVMPRRRERRMFRLAQNGQFISTY